MNQPLWNKVLEFQFETEFVEYSFFTRLVTENQWTISFAEQSILEYKKFMYLAATTNELVSPSPIVDIVWHQHLIFSHSYQKFCTILGKNIQHVPSTHHDDDFKKFESAKAQTKKLYNEVFGVQPNNIWYKKDMLDSLNLEKASQKIQNVIIIGVFIVVVAIFLAPFLLRPIYSRIDSIFFIPIIITTSIFCFYFLRVYNKEQFSKIIVGFESDSFIFKLKPYEILYLQSQKLGPIVNGVIHEMITNESLNSLSGKKLTKNSSANLKEDEQNQILKLLLKKENQYYPNLIRLAIKKQVFLKYKISQDSIIKYVQWSKKFHKIFIINLTVLSTLFILCFSRFNIGVTRDKPVAFIAFISLSLIVMSYSFLKDLFNQFSNKIIPDFYKNDILTESEKVKNWQWAYFTLGLTAISGTFGQVIEDYNSTINTGNSDGGSGCSSSSGSCGGSSCGGGCGGCGGGD